MKKYLLFIIIFSALIFGNKNSVNADDAAPPPPNWLPSNGKINCVTFENPNDFGLIWRGGEQIGENDNFLVFDYSSKIGEDLGRPWSVIEKGKCYQFDFNDASGYAGAIYSIKTTNAQNKEKYANFNGHKPTDNIIPSTDIKTIWQPKFDLRETDEINCFTYNGTLGADLLFPTKYEFTDYNNTNFAILYPEISKLTKNSPAISSLINLSSLSKKLKQQLRQSLSSCDQRLRVEYNLGWDQRFGFTSIWSAIWRFNDGKQQSFNVWNNPFTFYIRDPFEAIDSMGCHTVYGNFLNSHQDDFVEYDRLAAEITQRDPQISDSVITTRDHESIEEMNLFSTATTTSDYLNKESSNLKEDADFWNNLANTNNPPAGKSPTLEEPTSAKKIDILFNSQNPLMLIYIFLPLFAIFGILIFIFTKKGK